MAEVELDLDPVQFVRWLIDDLTAARHRALAVRATREFLAEPAPEADADDDEETVLSAVGMLEVRPGGAAPGWILRLRVENSTAPQLPDDAAAPEGEEEIALGDFFEEFIVPDGLNTNVTVDALTPAGKRAFDRVLAEVVTNRHDSKAR